MNKITFLLLIALLVSLQFSCNVSTATIKDVKLCTELSDQTQCGLDSPDFNVESPFLFVSCRLVYAPEDSEVTFTWYFMSKDPVKIDEVTMRAGDFGSGSTYYFSSYLSRPDAGWPSGDYEVHISLNTDNSAPVIKSFRI